MKWLLRVAVALLTVLVLAAGWLLGSESGLRWALGFAPPQLTVEGPGGALAREIRAERVAWDGVVDARRVSFQLNLLALLTDTVSIDFLRISELTVKRPEDNKEGGSFVLPVRIKVSDAQAKSVVFEGYEAHDVTVDYTGSALGHEIAASLQAAGARARVKASLDSRARPREASADVEALNLAVIDPDFPETALRARLSARGDADSASGRIVLENPQAGPLDRERLPIARAQADFSTDFSSLVLQDLQASLPGSGRLEGGARVAAQGATLDLRVRELDLRSLVSSLASTRLAGALDVNLEKDTQVVRGKLAQDDMSLSADVLRRQDELQIRSLQARAAGGEASGRGRVRLGRKPSFEADLKLARFDPSRFGDYPKGNLNGSVKGHGSLGAAREGAFAWDIAGSTLLEQPFASSGRARLAGERIADADAWATLGANRATAKGSFGGPRDSAAWTLSVPELKSLHESVAGQLTANGSASGTYARPRVVASVRASKLALPGLAFDTATLQAEGTLDAHAGELRARNRDLDLTARLKGGWSGGAWRGEILSLENAGERALVLQAPAPLEAAAGRVALGRFNATLVGGRLALESLRWQDGRLSSAGAFAALPAQSLLNLAGEKRVAGDLTLDGDWSILATPKLNGRLALRRAGGDLTLAGPPRVPLELSRATLDARFTDDRVAAALEVATRLGTLRGDGEAAGLTPDSAAAYTAHVELKDLRLLTEPLLTQLRVSGRIGATLKGAGTLGKPLLSGTLTGDALGVEAPPWGVALTGGRLRAELQGDRLRIVEAAIAGGDGRFSLRGALPLRLAEGGTALEWQAERFRVLNRPDMRLVVSGSGNATFDGRKFGLNGELRADSGHFELIGRQLPELDDDIVIAGRERIEREKRGPLPIDLDLRLDLGQQLTLRGYGYNGGVAGQLRMLTDSAGELQAQGKLRAVRASFRAYGQELQVDPGSLVFDGPLARPGLDITAWRRHQAVEAGVHVTGTPEAPRVELVSNPPVPDAEKLSWLVLGRAPSTASGADLAVLQAASGALFSMNSDQDPVQRRIAKRLGVDEITVRSSSDLSSSNVFALGKRLSDKLYLSFEQGLGATVEYLVKLDYSLTDRVSVRGQTGTSSGVGLFYRYAWD